MKIISIINQKGGTGKTTTAINLGVALARKGKRVMLVDFDSQGNLTYSFGVPTDKGTIADVLQSKKTIQSVLVEREGVMIAPSSTVLADVEVSLVNRIGRERLLRDKLREAQGFDYIFIDSPPSLSILTVNALNAAHEVLIPVQMEILSLQGLALLLNTTNEVRDVLNPELKICGIVPFMYDKRRNLSQEVLCEIEKSLKDVYLFKTKIRECVKIAEAPSFAKSVLAYAPGSNGTYDFKDLAREFLKVGGKE
jgi:chromosome partitioning protein